MYLLVSIFLKRSDIDKRKNIVFLFKKKNFLLLK